MKTDWMACIDEKYISFNKYQHIMRTIQKKDIEMKNMYLIFSGKLSPAQENRPRIVSMADQIGDLSTSEKSGRDRRIISEIIAEKCCQNNRRYLQNQRKST